MKPIVKNTIVPINTTEDVLELMNHNTRYTREVLNGLIRITNHLNRKVFWLSVGNLCLAAMIFKLSERCLALEEQANKETAEDEEK